MLTIKCDNKCNTCDQNKCGWCVYFDKDVKEISNISNKNEKHDRDSVFINGYKHTIEEVKELADRNGLYGI